MNLLTLLFIVFLLPLLLILLVDRGGQYLSWLASHLEDSDLLRLFKALEPIGIMIAVVALVLTLLAFREDAKLRRATFDAFKEEAEDRKAGAEGRAWSLIYQAEGSTGDGGRRYALQYLYGRGVDLTGLPLEKAYLVDVNLPGARLFSANLSAAILNAADLSAANLSEAKLIETDLSEANLFNADLREAKLIKTDLFDANLREADLFGAKLIKAKLIKTDLTGATLREADLSAAILSGAILHDVDLSGVKLIMTDLSEAILSGVRNLSQKQIDSAFYCEQGTPPKLPAGFKLPLVQECDEMGNPIKE